MPLRRYSINSVKNKRFSVPASVGRVPTPPNWVTANGSLGTVSRNSSFSTTLSALSASSITYSISSGNLPEGLTLGSSNGVISGTYSIAVEPSTGNVSTKSFNVRAYDSSTGLSSDASFTIQCNNDYVSSAAFSYTGTDQLYVVPPNFKSFQVKLWGAGGSSARSTSGAGGYTEAKITLPNAIGGATLNVIVGGTGSGVTGGYGGGGTAFPDSGNGGGGGGGRSALRIGAVEYATAGGGGGSGTGGSGAGGGGLIGNNGTGSGAGSGGTQTAGGAGGTGSGGTASSGTQHSGGASTPGFSGGAGGGGWWGGGGASGVPAAHAGAGGGSGFVGTDGSTALVGNELGSFTTFADTTARYDTVRGAYYSNTRCLRGGTANGSAAYQGTDYSPGTGGSGQNGYVLIKW